MSEIEMENLQENNKINCYKNLINYNAIQLWFIGECVISGLINNINIPISNSIESSESNYKLNNNKLQNGLQISGQLVPEYESLIKSGIKELENLLNIINKYNTTQQPNNKVIITTNSNSDQGLVSNSTFINIKVIFSAIPSSKTRIRTILSNFFGERIIEPSELDKTKDFTILFYLGQNLNNPSTAMTEAKGIFIDCNKTWKKLCKDIPKRSYINANIKTRCTEANEGTPVRNGRNPGSKLEASETACGIRRAHNSAALAPSSGGAKKSRKRRKGRKSRKARKTKKVKKSRKTRKARKARKARKSRKH